VTTRRFTAQVQARRAVTSAFPLRSTRTPCGGQAPPPHRQSLSKRREVMVRLAVVVLVAAGVGAGPLFQRGALAVDPTVAGTVSDSANITQPNVVVDVLGQGSTNVVKARRRTTMARSRSAWRPGCTTCGSCRRRTPGCGPSWPAGPLDQRSGSPRSRERPTGTCAAPRRRSESPIARSPC
jgi:hypothetical protein